MHKFIKILNQKENIQKKDIKVNQIKFKKLISNKIKRIKLNQSQSQSQNLNHLKNRQNCD